MKQKPNKIQIKFDTVSFYLMATSRSGHNFIKNNIESWIGSDKRYSNLENIIPSKFNEQVLKYGKSEYNESIKILCLRDLLNWHISISILHNKHRSFHSLKPRYMNPNIKILNMREKTPEMEINPNYIFIPDHISVEEYKKKRHRILKPAVTLNGLLDKWLLHAKEFKGDTNYLESFIPLYYDDFVSSKEYRKNICQLIGGTYNEDKLNFVPKAGNYSSFDHSKFQGIGSEMKVLERYKLWNDYKDLPEYTNHLEILKKHPALQYYIDNFEVSEDKLRFINSL